MTQDEALLLGGLALKAKLEAKLRAVVEMMKHLNVASFAFELDGVELRGTVTPLPPVIRCALDKYGSIYVIDAALAEARQPGDD